MEHGVILVVIKKMSQPNKPSLQIAEIRKSKRKRIPTKHLVYKDPKDDEEKANKIKKKSGTGQKTKKSKHDTSKTTKMSRVNFQVKKAYDKVRRAHTTKRLADVKSVWAENSQKLGKTLQDHYHFRTKSTPGFKISSDEMVTAFQDIISGIQTSRQATFRIYPEETFDPRTLKFTEKESIVKTPVITIPPLLQIPPVLAWTSIPYNIHEDDGKFLTNIPFLGDEIIDKDKKFIDDMVNLYDGKIHGINSGPNKATRMEDDVFHSFVEALMAMEAKHGKEFFKDDFKPRAKNEEVEVEGLSCSQTLDASPAKETSLGESMDGQESTGLELDSKNLSKSTSTPSTEVLSAISSTFKGIGTVQELKDRYEAICQKKRQPKLPLLPNGIEQHTPSSYSIPNIEGSFAKDLPKEAAMHAYQFLFCRRCFQYDCTRGHNGDDHIDLKCYKPNRNPQNLNLNYVCEDPDCWLNKDASSQTVEKSRDEILKDWTPGDKSMFRCLIDSFPSHCYVAKLMMNKTCSQVHEFASIGHSPTSDLDSSQNDGELPQSSGTTENPTTSTTITTSKRRLKPWNKKSSSVNKKNVARRWINNVKRSEKTSGGIKTGGVLPPKFMPCQHDHGVECDDKNPLCYCGKNGTSCEKFCGCPATCQRRFPGCRCSSTCDSKRCVCFFAARECDPDLCTGCGAHELDVDKFTCRNVNIQRRLHKHLLMGKSDVAGWGIFIKEETQKGEFIAEYRGEIISHDESERRGHVYDKIQHTFLFELNDHYVVDATRKGNKSRFVNSSKNPNCEVKRMLVNGDHRIGIYAKRCIEAGEELFYDYEDVLQKQQRVAAASVASSLQHQHPASFLSLSTL